VYVLLLVLCKVYDRIQDNCVHLYDWDGHVLKETGVLTGNKRAISAIKFSPDLNLLASGDVSALFTTLACA
jgi:WD40 repeat protein